MSTDPKNPNAADPSSTASHKGGLEEVIHTPRHTSKARFIMTFLLVVMVLTTFTVSDQLVEALGFKDSRGKDFLSWTSPDGTKMALNFTEFTMEKRALALHMQRGRDISDDDAAYFIVLDDAAEKAGIRISDEEIRGILERSFQNAANYDAFVRSVHTTKTDYEATLRRILRRSRYQSLLSAAYVGSNPETAAKNWRTNHQEVAYDFVELPVAGYDAEALAAAPQGEELNKWFTARPQPEQDKYKMPEAVAAELAAFTTGDAASSQALVAKYPLPADFDAEKAGRDFHTVYGYQYFKNPDPAAANSAQGLIKPFEEVKDRAIELGKAQAALDLWLKDLLTRTEKGETIDLSAEAVALGLTYRTQGAPLSQDGWQKLEIAWLGARSISGIVHADKKLGFVPNVIIDDKTFLVTRILQRDTARMPDFAEIADRVAKDWALNRAQEMVKEKLTALREKIGTKEKPEDPASTTLYVTDSEKFAAAAKELGLEVKKRDYKDKSVRMAQYENPAPSDIYLQSTPALGNAEAGTVAEPALNADKSLGFLVLVAGRRDPDDKRMNVREFQSSLDNGGQIERYMFQMRVFGSREYFQQQFSMHLKAWDTETPAPAS